MSDEKAKLIIKMEPTLKREMRIQAAKNGVGMSAYIRALIKSDLDKKEKNHE